MAQVGSRAQTDSTGFSLWAAHQILLPFSTARVGTRPQEFKVEGCYWDWHPCLDYNMLFPLRISKSLLLSPENLDELLHR